MRGTFEPRHFLTRSVFRNITQKKCLGRFGSIQHTANITLGPGQGITPHSGHAHLRPVGYETRLRDICTIASPGWRTLPGHGSTTSAEGGGDGVAVEKHAVKRHGSEALTVAERCEASRRSEARNICGWGTVSDVCLLGNITHA